MPDLLKKATKEVQYQTTFYHSLIFFWFDSEEKESEDTPYSSPELKCWANMTNTFEWKINLPVINIRSRLRFPIFITILFPLE